MIEELQSYIYENWDRIGEGKPKPRSLRFFSYSRGVNKKIDFQKIFFFIFAGKASTPFLVAKQYRKQDEGFTENYNSVFFPKDFGVVKTVAGDVLLEEFISGESIESQILNSKKENLLDLISNHLGVLKRLKRSFTKDALDVSLRAVQKEIKERFDLIPKGNIRTYLEDRKSYLFDLDGIETKKRLVNHDLIPQNVYLINSEAKVIDYEFARMSPMYWLEEFRFIFYYLFLLAGHGKVETNFFSLLYNLLHGKNKTEISEKFLGFLNYKKDDLISKLFAWTIIEDLLLQYDVYGSIPEKNLEFYSSLLKLILDPEEFISASLTELEKLTKPFEVKDDEVTRIVSENLNLKAYNMKMNSELESIRTRKFYRFMRKIDNLKLKINDRRS